MFAWIEASIRYSGRFSKNEKATYSDIFGLSEATVSRHQVEFQIVFEKFCGEDVFERDRSGRIRGGKLILESGASIPSRFAFQGVPSLDQWLPQALGKRYLDAPSLRSEPPLWILRILVSAMSQRIPVFVAYQSRTRSSERVISPLVIVKVAGRHHLRAHDHSINERREFVLSRITHIETRENDKFHDKDPDWDMFAALKIEERPAKDVTGIRLDFGLDESGERTVRVREPLVQYLIDDMRDGYESPVRVRSAPRAARRKL